MKTIFIVGLEEWESKYWKSDHYDIRTNEYKSIDEPFCLGVDDYSSPKNSFADKLNLYKYQGLDCGLVSEMNDLHYDCWIKPRTNYFGLGYKSKHFNRVNASMLDHDDSFLFVENFVGDHYSIDYVLKNGEIVWNDSVKGIKDEMHIFKRWEMVSMDFPNMNDFVRQNFDNYTGHLNLEVVGDKILEVHTRPSCQFIDLYNVDYPTLLISTMFELEPKIEYRELSDPRTSWVYWFNRKEPIDNITLMNSLGSLQLNYKEGPHINYDKMPAKAFRIATVNTVGTETRPELDVQFLSNKSMTVNSYMTELR